MDVPRQSGDMGQAGDVLLAVEDCLIQVGDGPPLGDVEAEEAGELRRGLAGEVFCQVRKGASRFQSLSKAR